MTDWIDNPFKWWMENDKPDLGSFYVGLGYKIPLMPTLMEIAYHLDAIKNNEEARLAESGVYLLAAALAAKHVDDSDRLGTELMAQVIDSSADEWLKEILEESNE